MIRLPVSGIDVQLRLPDGADDMALIEGEADALAAGLRLIARLAETADDGKVDWERLPVTDFEILMLRLRETLLGGIILSHCACPNCRERIEISFGIQEYLATIRPVVPAGLASATREGWLLVAGTTFRLPCVADLLSVQHKPAPGAALRALCLAADTTPPMRRRIENMISRMAPPVTGPVGGACPQCGTAVQALFDVAGYVVAELRRLAARVYAEVHLIATAYGWTEDAILALSGPRRRQYAELVRAAASRSLSVT